MRGGFPSARRFGGIGTPGGMGAIPANQGGNSIQGQGIPFVYSTPLLASLAAAATSTSNNIQFDANSVFVWLRSTFSAGLETESEFVTPTYSSIPMPQLLVNIQDTGKGASFMNTPPLIWNIASNVPGLPYVCPCPSLIAANSTWSWTFNNIAGDDTYYNIQFNLHGIRVFNPNITSLSQLGF